MKNLNPLHNYPKSYPNQYRIETAIKDAIVLLEYARQWTPVKGKAARLYNAAENARTALIVQ